MMENVSSNYFRKRTLVSREVDTVIEQIIDLILRDYFFRWSSDLLPDTQSFIDDIRTKLKNELWIVLRRIITRLQRIDTVTFFTSIVARHLQDHFKKFNLDTTEQIEENQRVVVFSVSRHLEDERAELEYLRKICEFLLKILLPYEYASCKEFIHLIREVLTCHVLQPAIDSICDPFFVNHQAIVTGFIGGAPGAGGAGGPRTANTTDGFLTCGDNISATTAHGHNIPNIIITNSNNNHDNTIDHNASSSNHTHQQQQEQQYHRRRGSFSHFMSSSSKPIHKAKVKLKEYKQKMMCEIFELKGGQHWLRRTVVMFFHLVFDKTIDKQVRDCLSGLFSEISIARYLIKFRDTFWPNGQLADPNPTVSDDDRKLTYLLAKQHLINNIPDVFISILGQKNARLGFAKVFEALQCKKANKQLFYDILESFLYEFAPELKA
ncbi:Sorting nexin-25 [Fragariocoptes setiger]|uniref:Sorting nexin-25 n=1 Tax=Fragariocoptes setiger TaxID=1670756 RepID=A0ABQ7S5G5_9ACAR|nr:Sorting nexin-25 [Fragariocoptes setiger]